MKPNNLLDAKNRDELREWLKINYNTATECWVTVKRGRPKDDGTFWYIDAVEEVKCGVHLQTSRCPNRATGSFIYCSVYLMLFKSSISKKSTNESNN